MFLSIRKAFSGRAQRLKLNRGRFEGAWSLFDALKITSLALLSRLSAKKRHMTRLQLVCTGNTRGGPSVQKTGIWNERVSPFVLAHLIFATTCGN